MPPALTRPRVAAALLAAATLLFGVPPGRAETPVLFERDVMAVLSKAGCNSGPCHGNRQGKGGFRLSLRGEDPAADYASLVHGVAGRRLDFARPDESLLLLKPTTAVPHEGQRRLVPGSAEYEILRRWIAARAPADPATAPRLRTLRVTPREEVLHGRADRVRLRAMAEFTDGSRRDVTALACYEAIPPLADLSPDGQVTRRSFGQVTVLVRYLDQQVPVRLDFVPERPHYRRGSGPPAANPIDRHIVARLRTLRLNPAELCRDEVFCRRAHLDLLGLPPTAEEARAFVADPRPDKRARLVDTLLERPEFAEFWALKWADLLRADERTLDLKGLRAFHGWIRDGLAAHRPLDEFVRGLLAARGSTYEVPPANFYRALRTPVERAEAAAQVFLGTRLQCAQCHNHPYERWTQDDYHEWTAVFARVGYRVLENRRRDDNDGHEFIGEQIVLTGEAHRHPHPRLGSPAEARFLGEARPLPREGTNAVPADALDRLARWLTRPDHPLFARAQANRIWFHLMGRGLVDPVDDFRSTNPASHPELLEYLAGELVRSGFDLRHLIRQIMNSSAYQLSSTPAPGSEEDTMNYAHTQVRRLAAEQLLDAEVQVTGVPLALRGWPVGTRAAQVPNVRLPAGGNARRPGQADLFLRAFGKPPRQLTSECERSCEPAMNQAFQLISGPTTQELITDPQNRLASLLRSGRPDREVIEELYWSALTRPPTTTELTALLPTLRAPDRRAALEDLLWALLNAKEFVLRQ
ncbi:MAG: hypothetical protein RJA22_2380 [Verrucomicrobiota bacterium]